MLVLAEVLHARPCLDHVDLHLDEIEDHVDRASNGRIAVKHLEEVGGGAAWYGHGIESGCVGCVGGRRKISEDASGHRGRAGIEDFVGRLRSTTECEDLGEVEVVQHFRLNLARQVEEELANATANGQLMKRCHKAGMLTLALLIQFLCPPVISLTSSDAARGLRCLSVVPPAQRAVLNSPHWRCPHLTWC